MCDFVCGAFSLWTLCNRWITSCSVVDFLIKLTKVHLQGVIFSKPALRVFVVGNVGLSASYFTYCFALCRLVTHPCFLLCTSNHYIWNYDHCILYLAISRYHCNYNTKHLKFWYHGALLCEFSASSYESNEIHDHTFRVLTFWICL